LDLIFTHVSTNDSVQNNYYLGLSLSEYKGLKAYGHGGFWGTDVNYFPDLNTSVSVFVLEKDKGNLKQEIMDQIVGILIN